MASGLYMVDSMSVQDRDLLTRLTQYFETLETRLAQGQGWFIFNAGGARSAWLSRFIQARAADYRPLISTFIMPWRDFALNAYVTEVELPTRPESDLTHPLEMSDRARHEYRIATGVSRATGFQMRQSDLLVVLGLRPTQRHEVTLLDATIQRRYARRLATMLLTPLAPQELAASLAALEGGAALWERLWTSMYERSLLAL